MGDTDKKQLAVRIFVWIIPRVNSTALLKCMSFVEDTSVWMEPYLTSYLNKTVYNPEFKKDDPVAKKMMAKQQATMQRPEVMEMMKDSLSKVAKYSNLHQQSIFTDPWVKKQLETEEIDKKFIFVKDQSFAIFDQLHNLPEGVPTKHAFLIRHPQEVYTSWKNLAVSMWDPFNPLPWDECHAAEESYFFPVPEFYQIHHKLWKHVKEHLDPNAVVIDGHDLTSNPDVFLPKMFEHFGIPFKPAYLEWPADPELVFSSWRGSNEVVVTTSNTTGTSRAVHCTKFDPPSKARGVTKPEWKITDEIKEYIDGAMPLYEEMYANRLT